MRIYDENIRFQSLPESARANGFALVYVTGQFGYTLKSPFSTPVKHSDLKKQEFVGRLVEICETSQPSVLADKLQISYQAARNYLKGRLPETNVLLLIARQTQCSIHWLLTGEGEKFAGKSSNLNTLQVSDQMKTFVRQQCLEVFNELFALRENSAQTENSKQKVVKIASEKIKLEKAVENSAAFSEKQR